MDTEAKLSGGVLHLGREAEGKKQKKKNETERWWRYIEENEKENETIFEGMHQEDTKTTTAWFEYDFIAILTE